MILSLFIIDALSAHIQTILIDSLVLSSIGVTFKFVHMHLFLILLLVNYYSCCHALIFLIYSLSLLLLIYFNILIPTKLTFLTYYCFNCQTFWTIKHKKKSYSCSIKHVRYTNWRLHFIVWNIGQFLYMSEYRIGFWAYPIKYQSHKILGLVPPIWPILSILMVDISHIDIKNYYMIWILRFLTHSIYSKFTYLNFFLHNYTNANPLIVCTPYYTITGMHIIHGPLKACISPIVVSKYRQVIYHKIANI